MIELLHSISHWFGLCGENHPSFITFFLSHNELLDYIKSYLRNVYN